MIFGDLDIAAERNPIYFLWEFWTFIHNFRTDEYFPTAFVLSCRSREYLPFIPYTPLCYLLSFKKKLILKNWKIGQSKNRIETLSKLCHIFKLFSITFERMNIFQCGNFSRVDLVNIYRSRPHTPPHLPPPFCKKFFSLNFALPIGIL